MNLKMFEKLIYSIRLEMNSDLCMTLWKVLGRPIDLDFGLTVLRSDFFVTEQFLPEVVENWEKVLTNGLLHYVFEGL